MLTSKWLTFLLGHKSGYAKFPCYVCLLDSRAQHWDRIECPVRVEMKVGEKNEITDSLVPGDKIIFPPLHIKLGLMKKFEN